MTQSPARLPIADSLACDLCEGIGDVDCLQCGGSGATEPIGGPAATCPGCRGAGLVCCPECGGSGIVDAAPRRAQA